MPMAPSYTSWLTAHHIPSKITDWILDYYNYFTLGVNSESVASDWHRFEKGLITGCSVSVTLFAFTMNMVVKAAEVECRGPITSSGVRQPSIRAYMDKPYHRYNINPRE